MVINIETLRNRASTSIQSFINSSRIKFEQFVFSGREAFEDFQTLVTVDHDKRFCFKNVTSTLVDVGIPVNSLKLVRFVPCGIDRDRLFTKCSEHSPTHEKEEQATMAEYLGILYQAFTVTNNLLEKRVDAIQKKGAYVTIAYLAFQLMLLNAISLSSSVKRIHWSMPFMLSLLVSLIYGIYLCRVINQFVSVRAKQDLNCLKYQFTRRILCGAGQDEVNLAKIWFARYTYIYFISGVLLAFAVIMLYACYALLCDNIIPTADSSAIDL
ncbi:hypothetical protein RJ641_016715 [Dillenia turbinata]|uniref:Uncharacterized protein n=1 Tax=Dillenia turbinata TaxID=194707 RepID=A0AAN8UK34_9MAGN